MKSLRDCARSLQRSRARQGELRHRHSRAGDNTAVASRAFNWTGCPIRGNVPELIPEKHLPDMARQPGAVDVVPSSNPSAIVGVGPITEMRLERDLGISTVRQVAEADLETLTQVWGVAGVRAGRMKGRSQGVVNKVEAIGPIHGPKEEAEILATHEHRVAVVAGQDEFEGLDGEIVRTVIDEALDKAGVELDRNTRVGYVADDMGGERISVWYDAQRMAVDGIRRQMFETPWTKYAYFLWDEWGYDEQPDIERPTIKTEIPFDVHQLDDIEAWMAPAERTQDMVQWADEVVVVADGDYTDSFRQKCDQLDVECTTVFGIDRSGPDPKLKMWEAPAEHDTDAYQPAIEETYYGGDGPRAGTPDDLDTDDGLTMAPSDSLDERPEVEESKQGEGVGSASYNEWIQPGH